MTLESLRRINAMMLALTATATTAMAVMAMAVVAMAVVAVMMGMLTRFDLCAFCSHYYII